MTKYNGWKNYETWNVALWIGNEESLYIIAKECALRHPTQPYRELQRILRELGTTETPDKVAYNDTGLDVERLDEMLLNL